MFYVAEEVSKAAELFELCCQGTQTSIWTVHQAPMLYCMRQTLNNKIEKMRDIHMISCLLLNKSIL